jgi:hypothetical protein
MILCNMSCIHTFNNNLKTLACALPFVFLSQRISSVSYHAMQVEEARKRTRAQAEARDREAALFRQELAFEQRQEQQAKVGFRL